MAAQNRLNIWLPISIIALTSYDALMVSASDIPELPTPEFPTPAFPTFQYPNFNFARVSETRISAFAWVSKFWIAHFLTLPKLPKLPHLPNHLPQLPSPHCQQSILSLHHKPPILENIYIGHYILLLSYKYIHIYYLCFLSQVCVCAIFCCLSLYYYQPWSELFRCKCYGCYYYYYYVIVFTLFFHYIYRLGLYFIFTSTQILNVWWLVLIVSLWTY